MIPMLYCVEEVLRLAIPPVISMFFQFFVQVINTYYVGRHLQDTAILAGVGMGNMLMNICCFAITNGLNSALETLVSQAFGAGKYKECGTYLNRGRVVVTSFLVPIGMILFVSDKILRRLGQDLIISEISREYTVKLLPGIWCMTQFDALRKFMIA